jgi:MFS family permease
MRDFALLWAAQLTSGLASQMLVVAIGWQVYEIHKNPFDLGLVGLMEFVPLPFLALPAGQLADRLPRRAVTAASYVVWIAVPIALVFVTLSGANALWPFLGLGAVTGWPVSSATRRSGR